MKACGKALRRMRDIIVCDFDETITSRDTISTLAGLPYLLNSSLEPKWRHFQDSYLRNYYKFQEDPHSFDVSCTNERTLPLLNSSVSIIKSSNFKNLVGREIKYQEEKRLLELSSTNEMAKHKLFSGITSDQVSQYVEDEFRGSSSLLRTGFERFMSSLDNYELYIISINWSKNFIRDVIGTGLIDSSRIFCNDLISDAGKYTGEFSNEILTGSDKLNELEHLLTKHLAKDTHQRFWYIGDSETDLLPILHPKVNGLLLLDPISEGKKFGKLTTKFLGISPDSLKTFVDNPAKGFFKCYKKENDNGVYLVKSWSAIQDLLHRDSKQGNIL